MPNDPNFPAEEDESNYGDQHMAEDPELTRDTDQPDRPGDFQAFGPKTNRTEQVQEADDVIEESRQKAAKISQSLSEDERHALEFTLNTIEEKFSYEQQQPWAGFAARLSTDVLDEYLAGKNNLAADNLYDLRQELEERLE